MHLTLFTNFLFSAFILLASSHVSEAQANKTWEVQCGSGYLRKSSAKYAQTEAARLLMGNPDAKFTNKDEHPHIFKDKEGIFVRNAEAETLYEFPVFLENKGATKDETFWQNGMPKIDGNQFTFLQGGQSNYVHCCYGLC